MPLHRELAWLRNYMAMMAERFRGKLEYELDVEPGLDAVPVPRLLIQPLVENALKHGLSAERRPPLGTVRRRGEFSSMSSATMASAWPVPRAGHGTGLANVARRLELLFAGRANA